MKPFVFQGIPPTMTPPREPPERQAKEAYNQAHRLPKSPPSAQPLAEDRDRHSRNRHGDTSHAREPQRCATK